MKRIYRIRKGKVLAGVCGGLSEYLNIDPSLVRIIAVLAGFAMFPWVVMTYIAAAIVIPEKKEGFDGFTAEAEEDEQYTGETNNYENKPFIDQKKSQLIFGGSIIAIGALLLLKNISNFFTWINFGTIFAIGMVAAGIYILFIKRNNV